MVSVKELSEISNALRRDALNMTSHAGSGHPTSCLSCAEIISCLFFSDMSYDAKDAGNEDNDEFILSKGHAAPIYYAALKSAGCISDDILSLRKLSSNLEGHPIPSSIPSLGWIKFATGSLGQGLSIGVGMALAAKLQKRNYRTYVLLGDSECTEGSVWEAIQIAAYYNLNNLCAIVDINKLGQRGETMLGHHTDIYKKRFESFGWQTIVVDGHNISEILKCLARARKSSKPCAILAKTIKGKGVSFLEGKNGWHGRALNGLELKKALKEIPFSTMPKIMISLPKPTKMQALIFKQAPITSYKLGEMVSTREAYGNALANLAKSNSQVVALDAEVSNSTYAGKVKERTPKQFIECFIAEQNMVGMALGLAKKNSLVFASTFAAFLTRAHDQLRMSALSQANMTLCGSHCGVSIGEDGASQMGLEDIALFRSLPNSIVLYPSDAVATEKLVHLAAEMRGLKYIRTTRSKTPIIYSAKEEFMLNDFKILRQSTHDSLVIAGAGITLHESIKAYEQLKKHGASIAVVDCYCIKPFNEKKLIDFVRKHGNKLLVVEDHYPEGGIGEMLSSACKDAGIRIAHLAIKEIPHSGESNELMAKYGINYRAIVNAALHIVR